MPPVTRRTSGLKLELPLSGRPDGGYTARDALAAAHDVLREAIRRGGLVPAGVRVELSQPDGLVLTTHYVDASGSPATYEVDMRAYGADAAKVLHPPVRALMFVQYVVAAASMHMVGKGARVKDFCTAEWVNGAFEALQERAAGPFGSRGGKGEGNEMTKINQACMSAWKWPLLRDNSGTSVKLASDLQWVFAERDPNAGGAFRPIFPTELWPLFATILVFYIEFTDAAASHKKRTTPCDLSLLPGAVARIKRFVAEASGIKFDEHPAQKAAVLLPPPRKGP